MCPQYLIDRTNFASALARIAHATFELDFARFYLRQLARHHLCRELHLFCTSICKMAEEEQTSFGFKFPPKEDLIATVTDLTKPLPQRMRSVFYLRTLGGDDSIEALCTGEPHSW